MSFAGWLLPSPSLSTALRAGGAPGLTAAPSFSRMAVTMRIVAVACAVADRAGEGVGADASKAAASKIMGNANALARKW